MLNLPCMTVTFALVLPCMSAALAAGPSLEPLGVNYSAVVGEDFRSCEWVTGRDVLNEQGEKIADASDLLIDRGSGRIDYIVVETGSILGLGGRSIAVPYGAFRWNIDAGGPVRMRFTISFDANSWRETGEMSVDSGATWRRTLDLNLRRAS